MTNVQKAVKFLIYLTAVNSLFAGGCIQREYITDDVIAAPDDAGENDAMAAKRGYSLDQQMVMGVSSVLTTLNGASLGDEKSEAGEASESTGAAQYTVQFAIVQSPNSIQVNGFPNLRAYIQWLTQGKQQTRWVSIGGGTSVTGSAEGVTVQLQDFTGTPAEENLADYTVYVAAVPGSRANSSVGPTLVPLSSEITVFGGASSDGDASVNLPSLGLANYAVPANVGIQSYYIKGGLESSSGPDTNPTQLVIQEFDIGGLRISQRIWSPSDGFVPLSARTTNVVLNNQSGNPISDASLVWGIDG